MSEAQAGKLQNALTVTLCSAAISAGGYQVLENVRQGAAQEALTDQRAQNIAQRNRELDQLNARIVALESRTCRP